MDFLCIPIVGGCSTRMHPDGDPSPRLCPRCNNVAVQQMKSRTWFELCCVPLFPFSSSRVWHCNICSWQVPLQQGWEPMVPQQPGHISPGPQQAYQQGYQPSYSNQQSYPKPQ